MTAVYVRRQAFCNALVKRVLSINLTLRIRGTTLCIDDIIDASDSLRTTDSNSVAAGRIKPQVCADECKSDLRHLRNLRLLFFALGTKVSANSSLSTTAICASTIPKIFNSPQW